MHCRCCVQSEKDFIKTKLVILQIKVVKIVLNSSNWCSPMCLYQVNHHLCMTNTYVFSPLWFESDPGATALHSQLMRIWWIFWAPFANYNICFEIIIKKGLCNYCTYCETLNTVCWNKYKYVFKELGAFWNILSNVYFFH